ncbi:hypothetical protein QVD17_03562 [Tagetes erecta]|uniref:Pectate lyase n=1 Tax=Tagetes erecta TaxID=13708 RepID=A0AAD8P9T8_TARER|nr:hypothetical protein QVD17_03562 [Tagetes erecta]
MLSPLFGANKDIIADTLDYGDQNAGNANAGAAMEAYNPELLEAFLSDQNETRRGLSACTATNPIDKCWRCKADWADNRQALAQCVMGFGTGTTGGAAGEIYTVTDPSDDDGANPKEGTLRYGASQNKPLWIIFEKDMVINLKHTLVITSDKTIDGRGANVEIANGGGFTIQEANNVIIHGLNIHDVRVMDGFAGRTACDGDALTIKTATKIWIDHCTFSKGPDGMLDVTVGSTAVTISNCRFHDHDKVRTKNNLTFPPTSSASDVADLTYMTDCNKQVILLGAADTHTEDKNMQVTVAYNKFEETCTQRMPRCRFGFFQVVNNDYNKWKMYAIGGSANPTILSQGNRFVAADNPNTKEVTRRNDAQESEWMQWNWRSSDKDVFENGAFFTASGSDPQLTAEQQQNMIEAAPGAEAPQLTSNAGVLSCVVGQPC